ncbi:LpxI family protein [Rhodovarius sp.]|uniref:LpxI family protein n=1 Tax=Rhodovarius sp. TaxID=2972673 RepID=UPI0034A1FF68
MTTTTPEATPLGIIAAGGVMPRRLADDVLASGRPVYVVAIREFAESQLYAGLPHRVVRLGAAGQVIAAFRAAGVRDLVMLGHARRPSLLSLFPDAWTASAIARVGRGYFAGGDDTLLRGVTRVLEDEGFVVRGVHELRAGLTQAPGLLAGPAPDAAQAADIRRGIAVLRAMGPVDVGQAVVVQQGLVLAVEAIEGTDAMLARAGSLRREGPGGVLVKLAKPGQDLRLDMPTIGPVTVENAKAAGLSGIAIDAGRSLVTESEATIALAARYGLFILSLDPEAFNKDIPS